MILTNRLLLLPKELKELKEEKTMGANSQKKILVVGSWAKEQITIENIKKSPSYRVFSYLDTKNPAIISLVEDFCLGSLSDSDAILNYAKKIKPDLILITTASPLAAGSVDKLEAEKFKVFGPKKISAQLESNKAFTRNLMYKYLPESLPEFKVLEDKGQAVEYAKEKNFEVAVKPTGLTEGLGVKVLGDQLKNGKEVLDYITQILADDKKGKKVIIEQRIQGEEFTLQCFVNGEVILPTWCVQDFKKLLPEDKGPNTASMGSYSFSSWLLPFMKQGDYSQALDIIKKTVSAFYKETGQYPCGFLYGQFMITDFGVKLIEYNFRPGDPEWMNTVAVLEDNIVEAVEDVLSGKKRELTFKNKATVCKYITPKEYPYKLYQTLDIDFNKDEIEEEGVRVYYSCGLDKNDKLEVGSERGIAFLAAAETIEEANKKVESAIAKVKGDFYYRKDIGTKQMIEEKIKNGEKMRLKDGN
ncbi:MAG: phosphoribosylamine--glycine ligase [Candidatus Omnitrophica bacterium]|nr:phosphoribosylamine--glycine ligase [Candidatus Omnitrophota bacterium]